MSLVAESDGQIVGHVLFSEISIVSVGLSVPALSLAPMAVTPDHQRQGIGSMLVREGLKMCRADGHRIVVVLGHPDFYPRFGFSAKRTQNLKSPFSGPAFMAEELTPGALEGVAGEVHYPPPFAAL
jgi:putative acetyltransferase